VADIFHPGDGEDRQVDMAIPMIGQGTDPEDGMLTGMSLVWTSDVEGQIGTGEMFDWIPTQVGMQMITLTATDSDNNQSTDSITLNIIP
jgi:chitinase